MKLNVAVIAVLATTLAGAPLIVSAADDAGSTSTTAPAKHGKAHKGKKSSKKSDSSSDSGTPK